MRWQETTADDSEVPPPELLRFDRAYWAELAPSFDERVDNWAGKNMTPTARSAARTFFVWCDARDAWRRQHGWPAWRLDVPLGRRN